MFTGEGSSPPPPKKNSGEGYIIAAIGRDMGFNIINTRCVLNEKQNSVQSSLNFIIQFKDQRCMSTVFKSCTCYHMKYPCIDGYGIKSCMETLVYFSDRKSNLYNKISIFSKLDY